MTSIVATTPGAGDDPGALAGAVALLAVPVLIAAVGAAVGAAVPGGGGAAGGVSAPSASARSDIPPDYLRLYVAAAESCPGLDWAILAAVGKVETDHGRSRLPGVTSGENRAGAAGPMQFLAATFTAVTARHPPPPAEPIRRRGTTRTTPSTPPRPTCATPAPPPGSTGRSTPTTTPRPM